MTNGNGMRPIEILLVEDSAGDIRLTEEVFKESKISNNLAVIRDGAEALAYLFQEGEKYENAVRPDLILLDLNLPKKSGKEVLAVIKEDENLRQIPVIILTISKSDEDIANVYNLHANSFITKPIDFNQFTNVVRSIEDFWLTIVRLPAK